MAITVDPDRINRLLVCLKTGRHELVKESNREVVNRNWSNQKANPALKAKTGNK